MFSISKTYSFEAAHRLIAPYKGKCNSVHGHSFEIQLNVSSETLNACEMVTDFSALNPIKEWLMAEMDHATLVSEKDGSLLEWLQGNQQKLFIVAGNPTSEKLAETIFFQAKKMGFDLSSVTVFETCTACATFTAKLK